MSAIFGTRWWRTTRMAKKKPSKSSAEGRAEHERFMERVWARIAEREAIDERMRLEREQQQKP
jgi:hypothetical protein